MPYISTSNDNEVLESLMNAGRICQHGEITDLTEGFSIPFGVDKLSPFSLFITKKDDSADDTVLVDCLCYSDNAMGRSHSALPVNCNEWTPAAITSIEAGAIDLDDYRVFWGAVGIV